MSRIDEFEDALLEGLHIAIEKHLQDAVEAFGKERAKEEEMVADAVANKTHLPNNYWQLRFAAQHRVNAWGNAYNAVLHARWDMENDRKQRQGVPEMGAQGTGVIPS